ncbi:hypothetical protein A2276_06875 [candidate division WOR-1 bacterium RIFOXYA12_FULL_43_27]|uniref:histidine kinase n=1 Tax=candidate division WOR-1 bacterium RIFOXYC2_FULL_46_14 TaxID=1802587 RepID=A0A1F4U5K1_UNCSA|nr:MAG: hypothetical protein A2276_06875 [candidate division WOR-1 bacterium RIFOXYA12_FULL_43_27]OGC20370.1 MAG: hypothetical protein A2292_04875 [candidate division WOR-1 bacterium RIFOXYB2_FULL_46_45]OGC31893.1 MAG: hypothetical protein A2232_06575 [candidate division WOR-1 bacterium RIFOXYA2_FULL_46_56]OGC40216.1 MAG: hypothetical protein A2438_02895 [candidate division WOR-1 bacterium RIFOXYC2_FULL_46_14]
MPDQPKILVVDDNPQNVEIMKARLLSQDYKVIEAFNGEEALKKVEEEKPDLILLDVMMPKMDGFQVCEKLKSEEKTKLIPVIIVSARSGSEDILKGLQLGADEYLPKPFEHIELLARVKNLLKLRIAQKELELMNCGLKNKVSEQDKLLDSAKKLERYFSPQVVKMIMEKDPNAKLLNSRKLLTLFVSDIDNFTGISEASEPEDIINLLNEYFSVMTKIAFQHGGTVDKFMGDGMFIFFGDPIPQEDHAERALNMALAMQAEVQNMRKKWKAASHDLQVSMGVTTGYVTVGNIGPEDRTDYTVIGNQVNAAFRLCSDAKPGQILVSQRTESLADAKFNFDKIGEVVIEGMKTPLMVYSLLGKK